LIGQLLKDLEATRRALVSDLELVRDIRDRLAWRRISMVLGAAREKEAERAT
jgi:hypothetical protein